MVKLIAAFWYGFIEGSNEASGRTYEDSRDVWYDHGRALRRLSRHN